MSMVMAKILPSWRARRRPELALRTTVARSVRV